MYIGIFCPRFSKDSNQKLGTEIGGEKFPLDPPPALLPSCPPALQNIYPTFAIFLQFSF
jgi:hypothetical protein